MKSTLRRSIVWSQIILLCMSLNLLASPRKDSSSTFKKEALQDGRWALMVGVEGGLTSGTFNGLDILMKRQLSPRTAIRFGLVDLHISPKETYTTGQHNYSGGSASYDLTTVSDEKYRGGIQVQYLGYFSSKSPVALYYAVGLSGNTGISKHTSNFHSVSNSPTYTRESEAWGAYSRCNLGMEYFTADNFALILEYNFGFGYGHDETTHSKQVSGRSSEVVSTDITSRFYLDAFSVELGFSFYLK